MKHAAEPFDDFVISLADEAQRVAPGEYHARVTACRRSKRFGRELLALSFELRTPGTCFGAVVLGYTNLDFGGSRMREIPARSKLAKWLRMINRFDPSISTTRVPLRVFAQYEFVVMVGLTQLDCNRKPLAPNLRYPQVYDIVRVSRKCENAKKEKKKDIISSQFISSHLISVSQGVTD